MNQIVEDIQVLQLGVLKEQAHSTAHPLELSCIHFSPPPFRRRFWARGEPNEAETNQAQKICDGTQFPNPGDGLPISHWTGGGRTDCFCNRGG